MMHYSINESMARNGLGTGVMVWRITHICIIGGCGSVVLWNPWACIFYVAVYWNCRTDHSVLEGRFEYSIQYTFSSDR